ncbi:MAG: PSD1 and planctomycete cytochrome C domain-containing protein [Verrucomicrobiota bacterium]
MNSQPTDTIDHLIRLCRVRDLTAEERRELNRLLRQSPDALDAWLDHAEMDTWLAAAGSAYLDENLGIPDDLQLPPNSASAHSHSPKSSWAGWASIAATITLLGILSPLFLSPSSDQRIAFHDSTRQQQYEEIVASIPSIGSQQRPPTSFENVNSASPDVIDFNNDIRPILNENCIACHGPDEEGRKAKLRLDTFAGATSGDYPAIIPGDPDQSEMMFRILSDDSDDVMPPPKSHKVLSPQQKDLLQRWIKEGAEYEEHWAFVAPEDPLPVGKDLAHPIDHLVSSELASMGQQLSPEADRHTLLRRASLDLTGLPPTQEIADAFLKDDSADAWDSLLDALLAERTYGEHRARYWLDAARYGDTHGLHLDNYREIWPYRDWVIQAYNDNMPFDQFTIEQLAGDLLPEPTQSQRVATGFNRCHVTTSEGGAIDEEFYVRYAVDRVSTTSTVWMGLTAACAQCHDHKFDPLSMKEFYELYAFFNNTTQPAMDKNIKDSPPVIHVYPNEQLQEEVAKHSQKRTQLENALKGARKAERDASDAWIADLTLKSFDALPIPAQLNNQPKEARDQTPTELPQLPRWGKEDSFTLAFRYKLPAHGDAIIFDQTDASKDHRGIRIRVENNRIQVELIESWPNRVLRSGAARSFKNGQAGHFAVSYDGSGSSSGIRMYLNGAFISSRYVMEWKDTLRDDFQSTTPAHLGGAHPQTGLFPIITEFRAFASSLPDSQVKVISQHGTLRNLAKKAADKRTEKDTTALRDAYETLVSESILAASTDLHRMQTRIRILQANTPTTLVMHEKEGPAMAHLLERGEYDQKGEEVSADFPAFLQIDEGREFRKDRLGLAQWLVDPSHPLTARVIVNRVWQELFGRGIVKTSEDFGTQGETPSHPKLLDYLALTFIKSGWDVKGLYRHIMTSQVYQQSSAITPKMLAFDPENRLFARGARFRMDAEMIRDQALFASGLLDPTIGGASVKPWQPPGLWQTVGYTNSNTQTFQQDFGASPEHRRSLYSFWKRTSPPPNMAIFDAPDRESCTVRRERTNTPLQALVLMNDPQYLRAARYLALRTINEDQRTPARFQFLAQSLLGRSLTKEERSLVNISLTRFQDLYRKDKAAADALLVDQVNPAFSLRATEGASDRVELAAWTMLASQLMNLDESLTKN